MIGQHSIQASTKKYSNGYKEAQFPIINSTAAGAPIYFSILLITKQ